MDITTTAVTGTRQHHVELIAAAWRKGVDSIIETGQRLIDAKNDPNIAHGEFLAMIESDLPFGARTAQRLMAIASHPVISKATHASYLPPSWMTLYELTKLPEHALQQKIDSGEITPKIGRATVNVWCGKKKRPPKAQPADPRHDDAGTPEECWRRSFAGLADEVLAARTYWSQEFGRWQTFSVPPELVTHVVKAAAEWDALLKYATSATSAPPPQPPNDTRRKLAEKVHIDAATADVGKPLTVTVPVTASSKPLTVTVPVTASPKMVSAHEVHAAHKQQAKKAAKKQANSRYAAKKALAKAEKPKASAP